MKIIILIIGILITQLSYSEEVEQTNIYFKLYPSIGLGIKPMADGSPVYATAKVFGVHYGIEEIGLSFLGVGYSVGRTDGFTFSPMGLRAANWMVTMDIEKNRADGAGLSLNYYFP